METIVQPKHKIVYYSYVLLFIVLCFWGLSHASKFLIPVALSGLFAMLLWPIGRFLEKKGFSRPWASGACLLILAIFLVGFVFFFVSQAANFAKQFSSAQSQFMHMVDQFKSFLQNRLGLNTDTLFSGLGASTGGGTEATGSSGIGLTSYISDITSYLKSFVTITFKTVVGIIIVFVYVFLMLLYRHVFVRFIQKLSPKEREREADDVSRSVARVSHEYLAGRLIVICIVAVINSVVLSVIGIQNAVFFGVLAAFLDLIPYIGIIIGAGLPLIMSLVNHDGWGTFLAVLGLFVVVQLLENYFLTPKIVGSKVRLNPLFTLMAVLVGGYLWGVAGMILFIPFLGMLKVVFDHVPALHAYGYLFGDPDNRTQKY